MTPDPPSTASQDDWHRHARQVRAELMGLLEQAPAQQDRVARILSLIDDLETVYRAGAVLTVPTDPRRASKPPRSYSRRKRDGKWHLVEPRPGNGHPFFIPLTTYKTAARVLARSDQPLKFEQLRVGVGRQEGDPDPPDYLCRVLVRYWLTRGLIQKTGTSYAPTRRSGFIQRTLDAFNSLPDSSRADRE